MAKEKNIGKKKWWRRWYFLVFWLVLLLVIVRMTVLAPRDEGIAIGKDTSFVDGPVNDDGSINYFAAFDSMISRGVTKENNAAVLLLQIYPLWPSRGENLVETHAREVLDVPPPGPNQSFFVHIDDFADSYSAKGKVGTATAPVGLSRSDWHKRYEKLCTKIWSAADEPVIAAWLKANEKPLLLVMVASKRERFYIPSPQKSSPPRMMDILLPSLNRYRNVSKALLVRATMRLGKGDYQGAWEDTLAVHRLARLIPQGGTVIHHLVGIAIESLATKTACTIANAPNLPVALAKKFLGDLQSLKPLPHVADAIDQSERMCILDLVMDVRRRGISRALDSYSGEGGTSRTPGSVIGEAIWDWFKSLVEGGSHGMSTEVHFALLDGTPFDWNMMLRMINKRFDRMVAIGRIKNTTESDKVASDNRAELEREQVDMGVGQILLNRLAGVIGKKKLSHYTSELLLQYLMPSLKRAGQLQHRAEMRFQLTKLAFALAAYRAEKGSYPAALADLKGKYIKQIPQDIFIDKPLVYKRTGKGYLLYSVGIDGNDDGGVEDRSSDGSDIIVRTENGSSR